MSELLTAPSKPRLRVDTFGRWECSSSFIRHSKNGRWHMTYRLVEAAETPAEAHRKLDATIRRYRNE